MTALTTWTLSRWSTEWVGPIVVTRDGTPVTGWTYAVLAQGQQPADETAIDDTPTSLSGSLGVLVGPGTAHELSPGVYVIWGRYVDSPEAPVLLLGHLVIE